MRRRRERHLSPVCASRRDGDFGGRYPRLFHRLMLCRHAISQHHSSPLLACLRGVSFAAAGHSELCARCEKGTLPSFSALASAAARAAKPASRLRCGGLVRLDQGRAKATLRPRPPRKRLSPCPRVERRDSIKPRIRQSCCGSAWSILPM